MSVLIIMVAECLQLQFAGSVKGRIQAATIKFGSMISLRRDVMGRTDTIVKCRVMQLATAGTE